MTTFAKGKVERPFRTVKDAHETLYHFHKPQNEAEANLWLQRYLLNYNRQPHRSEPHSRLEDWLANLPAEGIREMCTWEQFCRFAREPERRKVGIDARVSVDGTAYEVDPNLAGEGVLVAAVRKMTLRCPVCWTKWFKAHQRGSYDGGRPIFSLRIARCSC